MKVKDVMTGTPYCFQLTSSWRANRCGRQIVDINSQLRRERVTRVSKSVGRPACRAGVHSNRRSLYGRRK
jgi:hypothetical protein